MLDDAPVSSPVRRPRRTGPRFRLTPVDPAPGARPHALVTADGIRIAAAHDPPTTADADVCFLLAHGFTGSWRRPAVRAIARELTSYGGVVSFDFRGHGRSGGHSTVGDREVLDLEAALRWARAMGYRRVVSTGWSMGASVVVRHAALTGGVDAVVSVSGPSRWYYRGTVPMRRLHYVIERRAGRVIARHLLGTRIAAAGWDPLPESPSEVVGRIAPTPFLIVHGEADAYLPMEHALALYEAARDPKLLWMVPGFGHAEAGASPELVTDIATWAVDAAGSG